MDHERSEVSRLLFGCESEWDVANNTSMDLGRYVTEYDGDMLIGYADCLDDGYLLQVVVRESRRRQGVGRRLITELFKAVESLSFESEDWDGKSIEFAKAIGFACEGGVFMLAPKVAPVGA